MRRAENEALSEAVQRELEALDRALAGEAVDPDLEGVAELARELQSKRPQPTPEFEAELDGLSAEDFATGRRSPARVAERIRTRFAATRPMRLLAPAGALATLAIVVSVAVVASGGGPADDASREASVPESESTGPVAEGADRPEPSARGVAGSEAEDAAVEELPPVPPRDRLAPGRERRVERQASLQLDADRDQFAEVADGVIGVADRHRGIVVSSRQMSSGNRSRATFELAIPSARLGTVLSELSELAHVESRSETSLDITGPTVGARERRADARAEVDALRRQLEASESPAETRRIRERLDAARAELASARSQVRELARRARFANVSVTVTAEDAAGDWGLDDAVDDSGRILSTLAGVGLVGTAVLLPIALLALIGAATRHLWARRARERALDG